MAILAHTGPNESILHLCIMLPPPNTMLNSGTEGLFTTMNLHSMIMPPIIRIRLHLGGTLLGLPPNDYFSFMRVTSYVLSLTIEICIRSLVVME